MFLADQIRSKHNALDRVYLLHNKTDQIMSLIDQWIKKFLKNLADQIQVGLISLTDLLVEQLKLKLKMKNIPSVVGSLA